MENHMRKSTQKTIIATALTWALALPAFAQGATSLWVPGDIVTNLPETFVLWYTGTFTGQGHASYVPITIPMARTVKGIAFSASCFSAVNFRMGLYGSDPANGKIALLKADAGEISIPASPHFPTFQQYRMNFSSPVSISANTIFYVAMTQSNNFGCYIVSFVPQTFQVTDNGAPIYFKNSLTTGMVTLPGINDSRIPSITAVLNANITYGPWPSSPPPWGTILTRTGSSEVPIVGLY